MEAPAAIRSAVAVVLFSLFNAERLAGVTCRLSRLAARLHLTRAALKRRETGASRSPSPLWGGWGGVFPNPLTSPFASSRAPHYSPAHLPGVAS